MKGKQLAVYRGHEDEVTSKLWNIEEQKLIATLAGHKDEVRDVSFSRNGKLLASVSADNTIKVWDVQERKEITTFKGHSAPLLSVSFSYDSKYLASAGDDKKIIIRDLDLLNEDKLLRYACQSIKNYITNTKKENKSLCKNKI